MHNKKANNFIQYTQYLMAIYKQAAPIDIVHNPPLRLSNPATFMAAHNTAQFGCPLHADDMHE